MKKVLVGITVVFIGLITSPARAQVNVNINIGAQPLWGPVGYDYVEYYYLPDIEVYYYVPRRQYVYFDGGRWIFAASLPVRYRTYDLYTGYKVVVNEPRAYLHFNTHKVKYAKFKGNRGKQVIIRNSNDSRYYVVKGHPHNEHHPGKGKGKGKGKKGGD